MAPKKVLDTVDTKLWWEEDYFVMEDMPSELCHEKDMSGEL